MRAAARIAAMATALATMPAGASTLDELLAAFERAADDPAPTAAVRADFGELAAGHRLPADEATFRQYLRVKVVFEAVREAGWWRIAWDVTDREPRSDEIWAAWGRIGGAVPRVTATAECDESAALCAFLLRRLGVSAGLLWPTSNHTVAVWKARRSDGSEARVVLPTSQVFLDPADGLGTTAFDASRQRTIHRYDRADVPATVTLPAALGAFLVEAIRVHAAASDATQRRLRVLRSRFMAGEDPQSVERDRASLTAALRREAAPEQDVAAVEAFAREVGSRSAP